MIFRRDMNFEIDEDIIKKKQINVLTKDREWKGIVADSKNRHIKSLAKELDKTVHQEKHLRKRLKNLNQEKKKLINKILHLSNLLNTKGQEKVLPELERSKEEMKRVNDDIEQIMEEVEVYPKEIEKLNLDLLKETIKVAYKDMIINNDALAVTNEEMGKLRKRLGSLRDEKIVLEENLQRLYSFLHDIIGYEEMEKLDLQFLKEDEEAEENQ